MRKVLLLLLTLALFVQPATAAASSWPAFGKDQTRERKAENQRTQPPLYKKWEVKNIGWSISSPVTDGTYIYHVAGGYLYKIPLNLNFYDNPMSANQFLDQGVSRIQISNNPHVASHPTYDPVTERLYVGTGDDRVAKINPLSMRIERWYSTGNRVVAAPTVLGDDLIAYSTGNRARLFLAKGIERHVVNMGAAPAEITGTLAVKETSEGPIIFVPITYRGINRAGYVDAFRVIDNGSGKVPSIQYVWPRPFRTDNGVAASIVYDEERNRIYFSDKSGTVYAVNARNGKQVWKNTTYRHASSSTTLVNNSPALHDNTLVIPYRYQGGRNRGQIVAFDVRNGKELWTRTSAGQTRGSGKYQGEISAAPVITVQGNSKIVVYGNTQGVLRAVKLSNGKPVPVARDGTGERYSVRYEGGSPGSIFQGQGIATEIMMANGHIVFGANRGARPNNRGTNGTLYAYSTEDFWFMMPVNLTGRVHSQEKIPQYAALPVYFGPWNTGTEDIEEPFSVRLYVNDVMVKEKRFDRLESGEIIGEWTTVPSVAATDSLGKKEIRLEVDYYDEIDEPIKSDNTLYRYYEVVPGEPPKCPEGRWENGKCVKRWTEHYIHENRTRAVLIK